MGSTWWLLVSLLLLLSSIFASENEFLICNCEDVISLLSMNNIWDFQRASDFLTAVAHFMIPIQLLYFTGGSIQPSKWILVELIAVAGLCGMTHLLTTCIDGPHKFHTLFALIVSKMLAALVLCATAISASTLIPWLIQAKIREYMLTKRVWFLAREVEIIRRQNEVRRHVHMLTHEIRKSLDKNTILYTTLEELAKSLALQNCAVWVPNDDRTMMILTHQLEGRAASIPYSHPEVERLKETEQVIVLSPDSELGVASSGGLGDPGVVAAIRLPMLRVCYAILVLVAPCGQDQKWDRIELEMIKDVVDQVAVAISHADILEESQIAINKLAEEKRAILLAQENVAMAFRASQVFRMMMSDVMRKSMHTILGLLSLLPKESLSSEQWLIVNTIEKTSNVLVMSADQVIDDLPMENRRLASFGLHSLVREVGCIARCLCVCSGFGFIIEVDRSLPDDVVGDERSVFRLILHMVGSLLGNNGDRGGSLRFRASVDERWATFDDGCVFIRFEVDMGRGESTYQVESNCWVIQNLVEVMKGNIWVFSNQQGRLQSMVLVLGFRQSQPLTRITLLDWGEGLVGLRVLLADEDDMNREVTQLMLEKLGCCVTSVSSGDECLSAMGPPGSTSSTQVVLFQDIDVDEAVARARKIYSPPLLVVLSGFGEPYLKLEVVKRIGINALIRKPVVLEDLAAQLERALLEANEGVE